MGGGTQVELIPASVEVAEIAVEEEEKDLLEGADEEEEEDVGDAARVRLLAGDEAMVSINRAMVSAMLLLLLLLVHRRRVVLVGVLLFIMFAIDINESLIENSCQASGREWLDETVYGEANWICS